MRFGLFVAGYGAITTCSMLVLNFALPLALKKWFNDERWTTGREVTWNLVNVVIIAALNYQYTVEMVNLQSGVHQLMWFVGITGAVAVFPITAAVLMNERNNRTLNSRTSHDLNAHIKSALIRPGAVPEVQQPLVIRSANLSDPELMITHHDFYYARTADNYVEVYHQSAGKTIRTVVRATLKEIDTAVSQYGHCVRCHKSYIVNLEQVVRVSGNAQGYRLHFSNHDHEVPVSRSKAETLKAFIKEMK